jgi:uncharacterized membrane protein
LRQCVVLFVTVLIAGCQQIAVDGVPPGNPEESVFRGIYEDPVRLTNGRFTGTPFVPGGASRPEVRLLPQPRWQIDLDGDDDPETIVLLHESSGGSGSFIYLAATAFSAAASASRSAPVDAFLLGDRVAVKLVTIGADRRLNVVIEPVGPSSGSRGAEVREFEITDNGLVPLTRISGLLTFGHEAREFTRCGEDEPLWVSEVRPGVVSGVFPRPGGRPYQPKFVTILGRIAAAPDAEFAVDFDQQLVVYALKRMENEGPGCSRQFGDGSFRIWGEEPFWSIKVFADRLEYRSIDADARIFEFAANSPGAAWSEDDGVATARFVAIDTDGRKAFVELRAQSCQDTMAGNLYDWQAHVQLDNQHYSGCALSAAADR